MGTLTTNLQFYKPAASEFIDPEVQLNRNWDIADAAVRRLLEYEYSTVKTPNIANSVDRARFYKAYSNSVVAYFKSTNSFFQDSGAFVSTWISAKSFLQAGWSEQPDLPLYYRIVRKAPGLTTEIEWAGAAWTGDPGVTIDVNTNMQVIDVGGVPLGVRPTIAKYFTMWAGNTTSNYSIIRLFFGSDGGVEMKRYGSNPGNPSVENRIEFTGVKYNVEVTGT